MRSNFLLLTLTSLLMTSYSVAAEKTKFDINQGIKIDLAKDSSTLRLNQEEAVQKEVNNSPFTFMVLAGTIKLEDTSMVGRLNSVNYQFKNPYPYLSAQFQYLPWNILGHTGFAAGLGYSYSEHKTEVSTTALHLIPIQLELVKRFDLTSSQSFIPFFALGYEGLSYFQRGTESYNNSKINYHNSIKAGLAINLNRLHWVQSRNDAEIIFQYQKSSSETLQVGGSLSL
jgi:hypothetical protein